MTGGVVLELPFPGVVPVVALHPLRTRVEDKAKARDLRIIRIGCPSGEDVYLVSMPAIKPRCDSLLK
jgi:hypothetical protein